jgi:hypothetical protein
MASFAVINGVFNRVMHPFGLVRDSTKSPARFSAQLVRQIPGGLMLSRLPVRIHHLTVE